MASILVCFFPKEDKPEDGSRTGGHSKKVEAFCDEICKGFIAPRKEEWPVLHYWSFEHPHSFAVYVNLTHRERLLESFPQFVWSLPHAEELVEALKLSEDGKVSLI